MGSDEGLRAISENASVKLVPQVKLLAGGGHRFAPGVLAENIVYVFPLKI